MPHQAATYRRDEVPSTMTGGTSPTRDATRPPKGRYRWVICALLFFATTINYVDRGVLGVLAPSLQKEIGWTDTQYGDINAAFSLAYAIGFLVLGRFIDRVGTRAGYAIALVAWSLAAAGHALARSAFGFGVARFFLGLGEAGNFPAAVKTTAEWFPRRERALATGVFNAGSNVGAVLAPLLVPVLALRFGWRAAFLFTGLIGLLWVAFWLPLYRRPERHPRVSPEELAWIQDEGPEPSQAIPWLALLPHRQTWAVAAGKFLTDPVWWFYLFWSAKFLSDRFGVDLKTIGPPLITIYLMADVGSVAGGWLSSWLLRRGWTANAARKTAMSGLRAVRRPGRGRPGGLGDVGRRPPDRRRRGGAPGVLREPVYTRLGHVPAPGGRLGDRHRRHGRGGRRDPHAGRLGPDQGPDRELPDDVRDRRLGLPPLRARHPRARPAARAGPARRGEES